MPWIAPIGLRSRGNWRNFGTRDLIDRRDPTHDRFLPDVLTSSGLVRPGGYRSHRPPFSGTSTSPTQALAHGRSHRKRGQGTISDFDSAGFQLLVTLHRSAEGTLFQKSGGSRRRILADGERDGERILSEAVEQFGLNGGRADNFMALAHGRALLTAASIKLDSQTISREQKLKAMHEIWEDLVGDDQCLESPGWHAPLLHETADRVRDGGEGVHGWEEAKDELSTAHEMTVPIRDSALLDLDRGRRFDIQQGEGLGAYCRDSLS